MSFADISVRPQNQLTKLRFLSATGRAVFRILDEKARKFSAHYVNKTTVQCLGEECPICESNGLIMVKNPNPKVYRQDPGFSPIIQRFAVNVFDKTLVKKCPQCKVENPVSLPNCTGCNAFITGVAPEPSNTVKILQKGVKLFDQLNSLNDAVLNSLGDKIGLTNFDINLITSGTGTQTTYTAIPSITPQVMAGETVVLEVVPEPLFDLDKAVLKLDRDELLSLKNGVGVRDILIARQAVESPEPELVAPEPDTAVEEAARKALEEMLNSAKG
jgi:hypothetical protein